METKWDAFITEFRNSIPRKSLVEILRAFYCFCNDGEQAAKKIMSE